MDGVILPVAVTADEIEIPLQNSVPVQPAEKLPGFVLKPADVGVAVPLGAAVGTHHGRGGDQDLEGGVRIQQRPLQPGDLRLPPQGLGRTVLHTVGTAVVAALNQPDLQLPTDPVSAVGHRLLLRRVHHRHLLPKDLDAQGVGGLLSQLRILPVFHPGVVALHGSVGIGVVEAVVVVILFPIGGNLSEHLDEPRLHELLVPFLPQLGPGSSTRVGRMVVVDVISGPDKEVGLHAQDGGQGRIAQGLVRAFVLGTLKLGGAILEKGVVHPRHHHKAHHGAPLPSGQGLEGGAGTEPGM